MTNPALDTQTTAGLFVVGKEVAIPLDGVSVEATVRDFCTRVVLTQRYNNREKKPIEAVYVFPIDETAAVCGFEALIDDVHVVGEVQEKDEAFETYDEAIAGGHGAYLLDQERPDVFTASIGNIPPGKEVMVRITYVTELSLAGDDLRFVLPTTVSPRYAPAEDQTGVGRSPAEAVNPPKAWKVPYGLDLTINLDMPSSITSVESPSHPIAFAPDGQKGTVRLGERTAALDRDFVLLVRFSEPHEPRGWVEQSETGNTAMVAFQPKFEVSEAPCEIIFVVDRSGSMGGPSIVEARNALQLCLRSLSEGTLFNIVGFGSGFEMLFPKSRPYDNKSLAEANKHLKRLEANLGGTEILKPLKAVLESDTNPELPRQVFLLTDGQVSNTEAVLSLVRKHSDTTRVFTFGIGAGASHHLVRGIARAGEGACEFISPGERIEGKVLRQLEKAMAPALADVKVDWGSLRVRQAPHRIPPVFAGGRLLLYGFVEGTPEGTVDVTLNAKSSEGDLTFTVPLRFGQGEQGNLVTTLAAKSLLRDLEEGVSPFHNRKGSLQKRGGDTDRVKEEAVRLGVTYGLVSKWTSFVAVERRETPVEGEMELRKVPVALTRDWGGLGGGMVTGEYKAMVCRSAMPGSRSLGALASEGFATGMDASRSAPIARARSSSVLGAPLRALKSLMREESVFDTSGERPLDLLVSLQNADGSWELTTDLAQVLSRKLGDLEAKIPDAAGQQETIRRAWATALAVTWLENEAGEWSDEWSLLAKKARKWLERCPARPASGRSWLVVAADVVAS
jgi:hypothetical protein